MQLRAVVVACGVCVALMFAASTADGKPTLQSGLIAGASPVARWRAEVQSAPGREVLPMLPQQDISGMLALANGNVVVAGTVNNTVTGGSVAIAELLPNARLDPGFGDGGVELTRVKLLPWQILALPDGKLLILGPNGNPGSQEPRITRFPDWELLRLLPDGLPDPSFGHGGLLDVSGVPVAGEGADHEIAPELAPNGDIVLPTVIGPVFSPTMASGLVRLNPDGSRDTSFGSAGLQQLPASLEAFSVRPDGSTVVVMSQRSGALLLRLSVGGSPDPSFNGGSPLQLPLYGTDSVLVESDGAIELHGYPTGNRLIDSKIWRYTASGTPDATWGSGGATDLGASLGYISELLPASGGTTLLVTMGLPAPSGVGAARARVLRLTATGQIDPTLGGPPGLLSTLPFGGGSYAPGTIANLRENSFVPSGVIQRADGTLLFSGFVNASEAYRTEGGPEVLASISGLALAALDRSYKLDPTFTGATRLRVDVHVASARLSPNGIAVQLDSSDASLSVVTITAGGRTIAKGTVPFFSIDHSITRRTARIPLTQAGRRLVRRSHLRVRVTVRVAAADLAASHTAARTSATLAG